MSSSLLTIGGHGWSLALSLLLGGRLGGLDGFLGGGRCIDRLLSYLVLVLLSAFAIGGLCVAVGSLLLGGCLGFALLYGRLVACSKSVLLNHR